MSSERDDSSDRAIELLRVEVEFLRQQLNRVGMAVHNFQDQIPPQIAAELTSIVSSGNFCLPRGRNGDVAPLDLRRERDSTLTIQDATRVDQEDQNEYEIPQTIHVPPTHQINVLVVEGPEITTELLVPDVQPQDVKPNDEGSNKKTRGKSKSGYYATRNLCQQCGQVKKSSRNLNCLKCNPEKVVKRSKNQRKRTRKSANKIGKCVKCGEMKKVTKAGFCKNCYCKNYYHERKNDVSKHEMCKICLELKYCSAKGVCIRCRQEQERNLTNRKRQKTVRELLIESRRQEAEVLVGDNNVEMGFEVVEPNTEIVEDTNNVEMGFEMENELENQLEHELQHNDELFEMFFWFVVFVMSERSLFEQLHL